MKKYYCDICKYDAKQKSNYEKHLQTKKHARLLENHVMEEYQDKNQEDIHASFVGSLISFAKDYRTI